MIPVFGGGLAGDALEHPGKILGGVKGKQIGYLGESVPLFADEFFGVVDALLVVVGHNGKAALAFEQLAQIGLAVTETAANILDPEPLGQMG